MGALNMTRGFAVALHEVDDLTAKVRRFASTFLADFQFRMRVAEAKADPELAEWAEAVRRDAKDGSLTLRFKSQPSLDQVQREWAESRSH